MNLRARGELRGIEEIFASRWQVTLQKAGSSLGERAALSLA
jgi:hypothetical protein